MATHADRLSVHQLPSYSPDYNPIEHLWRNVKRDKTHNRSFPTFGALVEAVALLCHFASGAVLVEAALADELFNGQETQPIKQSPMD